jgi:hypothetical protein
MSQRKTIEVALSSEDMVWVRMEVSEYELSGIRAVVNALTAAKEKGRNQPTIELKEIEQ